MYYNSAKRNRREIQISTEEYYSYPHRDVIHLNVSLLRKAYVLGGDMEVYEDIEEYYINFYS